MCESIHKLFLYHSHGNDDDIWKYKNSHTQTQKSGYSKSYLSTKIYNGKCMFDLLSEKRKM